MRLPPAAFRRPARRARPGRPVRAVLGCRARVRPDGVEALRSSYWVRHDRAPAGHRGLWTSIANPGLDPDLSYYRGKAEVERLVRCSGIPCVILRPACFFGRDEKDVLIQNVAWAARRLACIPIPAGLPYFIRPIHVDDFAALVVQALGSRESWTRDAAGPDRFEFGEFVRLVARLTGGRARLLKLPLPLCRALYTAASLACRETILSGDELRGLSRNRLDSTQPPLGTTSLSAWLESRAGEAGLRFAREPSR